MADDIQSAFKELAAIPNPNKWMLFVAMGFAAGAIFAYLVTTNLSVQAQVNETCGLCQGNLNTMIGNFNVLAKTCSEARQFQRNISILPGIINNTVSVYAS